MTDITTGTTAHIIPTFTSIIGGIPALCCDARTLHAYLGNGDMFSNWFKARVEKYGFEEGKDYAIALGNSKAKFASQICETKNFASGISEAKNKGRGGHNRTDYHLSLNMAKELSMVENNEQGKTARRYFLECERKALEAVGQAEQKPFVVQPGDLLSGPQQLALRTMLESNVKRLLSLDKQGEAMKKGWSKLKAHFGVSYRKIPSSQFHEALDIIARHISDLEGVINNTLPQPTTPPLPAQIEAANEAANAIAAKVQAEVFKAVLSGGESWKYQRWMVAFVSDSQLATPAVVVPVPDDAVVMNAPKFIKAITTHDIPTSTETLIHIAQASMAEVQRRMTGQASLQLAA